MGTIILAKNVGLCDQGMRLIGRPLLLRLAEVAGKELQDDLRALAAEVEAASWKSSKGLKRAYPEARIDGRRVIVDLDERHCAVIIIDYERSVGVVEYAGASAKYQLAAATAAKSGRRK